MTRRFHRKAALVRGRRSKRHTPDPGSPIAANAAAPGAQRTQSLETDGRSDPARLSPRSRVTVFYNYRIIEYCNILSIVIAARLAAEPSPVLLGAAGCTSFSRESAPRPNRSVGLAAKYRARRIARRVCAAVPVRSAKGGQP